MDHKNKVTVAVSLGLVVLACLHAILSAGASRVLPRIERHFGVNETSIESIPVGGLNFDSLPRRGMTGASPMLSPNQTARDEVKHQVAKNCPPCLPTSQPVPANRTESARNNLAIFVGSDSRSQALLEAWNKDPQLQDLRSKVNFHVYTASNPLYLTRYASVIKPDQFPGLIFTSPDGGHIHAVNGSWLPTHGPTLYSDLQKASELKAQVVSQRQSVGSVGSSGGLDCVDGSCDVDGERKPLDRDKLFPLFDRNRDVPSVEGLLRAVLNPGETLGVLALSVVAVIFALMLLRRQHS